MQWPRRCHTRTIESPTARKLGPADYYVHTPVIIISASGAAPLCNYEHRHGARNVGATKRRRSGGPHDRVVRAKCQFTCDKLGRRRRRRFRCVVTTSVRHAPVAPPPVSDSSPWFAPSNPIQSTANKRAQAFLFARIFYNIANELKHLRFQFSKSSPKST